MTLSQVRKALSGCVAATMLAGCVVLREPQDDMQPPIAAPGAMPQTSAIATHVARGGLGPLLYVGGFELSMYALGSSTPLHVAKVNPPIYKVAMALDLHGHLCEANGEITYAKLFEYDADTLKFRRGLSGVGAYAALVADHLGYLYASTGGGEIEVYAPGCTHRVNVIHRGVDVVGDLVFDHSGNLYAGMQPHYAVSVYAPSKRPGHMKLVRQIRDGVSAPGRLAIGPSGDLFVANWDYETKSA